MKLTLLSFLLLFVSCAKEYKLDLYKNVENFKCPNLENCLSSKNKGENYLLAIKMMGEDEAQNISNIYKVVKQFEEISVVKHEGPYLYVSKDDLHIEFIANKDSRSVLIRSQKTSKSIFSSNLGKKLIEEIRFKLYQNDY